MRITTKDIVCWQQDGVKYGRCRGILNVYGSTCAAVQSLRAAEDQGFFTETAEELIVELAAVLCKVVFVELPGRLYILKPTL